MNYRSAARSKLINVVDNDIIKEENIQPSLAEEAYSIKEKDNAIMSNFTTYERHLNLDSDDKGLIINNGRLLSAGAHSFQQIRPDKNIT
jgi:hypothetical protein